MAIKRRIWIINAKFQWSLVAYTVGVSFATSLVSGWMERQNGHLSPGMLMLILVAFNLFIVVLAMWVSHRLAGPIYRLQRVLQEGAQGAPLPKVKFRRGDCFPELGDAYNAFAEAQQKSRKQDGFSVFELLIVTGIVSVLAAISVATLTSPRDAYNFKAQVASVEDLVLTARNAAFTRNECAVLSVNDAQTLELNTYANMDSLCAGTLPTSADIHQILGPLQNATLAGFTPTGSAGAASSKITFLPKGGTSAGSPMLLTVSSTGIASGKTITIYPAIGQVRIQ